jgi:hypothetical protein
MKTKNNQPQSGFLGSRALIAILFCAACSIVIPAMSGLTFFRSQATANVVPRTLTFAERVSFQRDIEEVYWRHRIWPRNSGERPDPKPSLDAVMSQEQLEKKVTDYLRNSQALEDYWQRPITLTSYRLRWIAWRNTPSGQRCYANCLKPSAMIPLSSPSVWLGPC